MDENEKEKDLLLFSLSCQNLDKIGAEWILIKKKVDVPHKKENFSYEATVLHKGVKKKGFSQNSGEALSNASLLIINNL